MIPPVYPLCARSAAVISLLDNPPRVFPFGEATENTPRPYAVWQIVGGGPDNCLDSSADSDSYIVQVDVYGKTDISVLDAAGAVIAALEVDGYVTAYNGSARDAETKDYRYSFTAEFVIPRRV
jgi:hypothetical protein